MSNQRKKKYWNKQVLKLFMERRQANRKRREARQEFYNQIANSPGMIADRRRAASAAYFENIAALVPLPMVHDDLNTEENVEHHVNNDNNDNNDKKEEENSHQLDSEKVSSMEISQTSGNTESFPMQEYSNLSYLLGAKNKDDASNTVKENSCSEEKGKLPSNPIIVPCEKCIVEEVYDSAKPHCSTRDVRCPFNSINLLPDDRTNDNIHAEDEEGEENFGKGVERSDKVSVITDKLKRVSI